MASSTVCRGCRNFNPRSSCEERLIRYDTVPIHAQFQSTLLMRGATKQSSAAAVLLDISIHAPHARSDAPRQAAHARKARISIHAPHARSDTSRRTSGRRMANFNPRSSCEERRPLRRNMADAVVISIHAPHARSDDIRKALSDLIKEFQSTLLMRGATVFAALARQYHF